MCGSTAGADGAPATPSCGEQSQREMDGVTVLSILHAALEKKLRPNPKRLNVGRQRPNRGGEG